MESRALRTCLGALALAAATTGVAAGAQSRGARFAPPNLAPDGVRDLAAGCAACHGTRGVPAAGSSIPRLAGRDPRELRERMLDFRAGNAAATVMHQLARGYSDAEIEALSRYFAAPGG